MTTQISLSPSEVAFIQAKRRESSVSKQAVPVKASAVLDERDTLIAQLKLALEAKASTGAYVKPVHDIEFIPAHAYSLRVYDGEQLIAERPIQGLYRMGSTSIGLKFAFKVRGDDTDGKGYQVNGTWTKIDSKTPEGKALAQQAKLARK